MHGGDEAVEHLPYLGDLTHQLVVDGDQSQVAGDNEESLQFGCRTRGDVKMPFEIT